MVAVVIITVSICIWKQKFCTQLLKKKETGKLKIKYIYDDCFKVCELNDSRSKRFEQEWQIIYSKMMYMCSNCTLLLIMKQAVNWIWSRVDQWNDIDIDNNSFTGLLFFERKKPFEKSNNVVHALRNNMKSPSGSLWILIRFILKYRWFLIKIG